MEAWSGVLWGHHGLRLRSWAHLSSSGEMPGVEWLGARPSERDRPSPAFLGHRL